MTRNDFKSTIDLLEKARYYYITCVDMWGNYTYINSNYANRFKHIDADFAGKPFHITMHPEDLSVCAAAAEQCLREKDHLVPATIRKHDGAGGYIITQWEFKGIFDANGDPDGVFCLGYDITDYIDQLAKKDTLLNDIAFSQSHVIRKPVANILGVIGMLQDTDLPPEAKELMEILLDTTLELDGIIRQIANDIHP